MGDMYENFGNAIAEGIYAISGRRRKQQDMEDEYEQRLKLLQEQSRLQDLELTPEQKLMRMYQGDPQNFQQFRMAMDPMAQQEFGLKQGQLANQQRGTDLESQKLNWMMKGGGMTPPSQQQNFQWLMQLPGMTQEKALQFLFRPDLLSQFMQGMGVMGGSQPGGLPIGP